MKHVIGRGLGFRDSGPCKGLMKHILSRPMGIYQKKVPLILPAGEHDQGNRPRLHMRFTFIHAAQDLQGALGSRV